MKIEIKQKIEMSVATHEKYFIRQSSTHQQTACTKCGEPMLTAEQTAKFFGIKQRLIFQLIEANATHFTESPTGAVLICITSLAKFTNDEIRHNRNKTVIAD